MRVRLDIGYDGTEFSGWAAQPGRRTVEGELSAAVAQVLRLVTVPRIVVAGRTDAGVHARGQVAHVDLPLAELERAPGRSNREPPDALRHKLSGVLPPDIVLRGARVAPPGFDARFSALQRRYAYRICDDPTRLDPLRRREVLVVRGPLDATAMKAASLQLLGLHDFAAFCRHREGATTARTLRELSWTREGGDALLVARVVADAFCHSMVRSLVGALLEVGRGRRAVDWPGQLLAVADRDTQAAPIAPPVGLCLEEVSYPPDDQLAPRAEQTRARRDEMTGQA